MANVWASDAVTIIRGLRCRKKKINEVVNHIMSIVSELRSIRSLLNHSSQIEVVERLFRFIAHEFEDVLETVVVDHAALMLQKNEGKFIKTSFRTFFPVLNDRLVLKHIKQSITFQMFVIDCIKEFLTPSISNIDNEPSVVSQGHGCLRQTYPRGVEEYYVGMDDELEKLVSLIVKKRTRVISIWGVAGSGKTTITGIIFNQPEVRNNFEALAWVCLSQGSQIQDILHDILRQLNRRRVQIETLEMEILKEQLKDVQRKYDCLIVLDNVQDIDQWKELSLALKMEGVHSVILITTREENIANEGFPHKLRLLNEDEAWDSLKKHAFPRKDGPG